MLITRPALYDAQVLVRHNFVSVDPFMPVRMYDVKSFTPPPPLNVVMQGGAAAR